MRCPKSVTPKKVEANRRNSKLSRGPRTERGRHIAKFNAVTLGLFAKHVVIPCCDGYNAEKDFQSLLDGLHQEFLPIGSYEEWLVVKIAECMWRLRRATRFESGAVREAAIRNISSDNDKENDEIMMALVHELQPRLGGLEVGGQVGEQLGAGPAQAGRARRVGLVPPTPHLVHPRRPKSAGTRRGSAERRAAARAATAIRGCAAVAGRIGVAEWSCIPIVRRKRSHVFANVRRRSIWQPAEHR